MFVTLTLTLALTAVSLGGCLMGVDGESGGPDSLATPDGAWALEPEPLTEAGELPRLLRDEAGTLEDLPLQHTHVRATLSGAVARVEVVQRYHNPSETPIEARYVFPLPANAAVDAMRMTIGDRVVEARIDRRDPARRAYEEARADGLTAALLEQERPDVFTQSLANVAPGEDIEVTIAYVQTLTFDAGTWEFVFPMAIGPRYIPGDPARVPDAHRISPPILGAGLRTGHDISLELVAEIGVEVAHIASPTHTIALEQATGGRFALALAAQEVQPDRDFVVRYHTGTAQPAVGLVSHKPSDDASHGYFTLMVQPPALDLDTLVGQRELVFVVDVSGSMSGRPLAQCKEAMRGLLRGLRPQDTFNLITFASREAKLYPESVPATQARIDEALAFVGGLRAGGGTELGNAVAAALGAEPDEGRHRYVFFMTDAQVGQDDEILRDTAALIARYEGRRERVRVFSLGAGHNPNRHLLEKLATTGHGLALYTSAEEAPVLAVDRFFGIIDHAVMETLTIDWGGLAVEAVEPAALPDLFASRPLLVHGRYTRGGQAEVVLRGEVAGEAVALVLDVALPETAHGSSAQATLWARSRIDALERSVWAGEDARMAGEQIAALGLEHGLVTAYTSFVAVDPSRVVGDGRPARVDQPSEPVLVLHDVAPMVDTLDRPVGIGAIGGLSDLGPGSGKGLGASDASKKPTPHLELALPTLEGTCDPAHVEAVLRKKVTALRSCYERQLLADATLQGFVTLVVRIGLDGGVTDSLVAETTLANDKVETCLLRVTKRLRFDEPVGGVCSATVALHFAP